MKKQFVIDDEIVDIDVIEENASFVLFNFNGEEYSVNLASLEDGKMVLNFKGKNRTVFLSNNNYITEGMEFLIEAPKRIRRKIKSHDLGQMKSPMPGKILKLLVKVGDKVELGFPLLIMEAMKMEHTIKASKSGTINKIYFKEGEQVAGGVELVNVK